MKSRFIFLRITACLMALLLLSVALLSCGASKNPAKPDKKTVVGTVDGRQVYYDELYFLVNSYRESAEKKYGDDPEALREELDRLFRDNVRSTYAMIRLCEERGLTFSEREWADQVDSEIESYVTEFFQEDEELFEAEREEVGLSERYFRYLLATELFYNQLLYVYPDEGLVESDEEALERMIDEEFIHVYHLAIFNDEGDDPDMNLEKIQEAHSLLKSGKYSMYDLIKKGYTEDLSDVGANGEYIIRGTVDEAYEDAAFSLRVGDISDVIEAEGINNENKTVSCYYVIQRFAPDPDYVESHYTQLVDQYYGSVIAADLKEVEDSLSFEPNELYEELDLINLVKPKQASIVPVIVISCVAGVLVIGLIIVLIVIKKKHAAKNVSHGRKPEALAKGESHERS